MSKLFWTFLVSASVWNVQADDSYLPLAIGNSWVYRYSTRGITNTYFTETVIRTEAAQGETWFVIQSSLSGGETLWRWDNIGRLLRLADPKSNPQLMLDPSGDTDALAEYHIVNKGIAVETPLGRFADALDYRTSITLGQSVGRYVRGLGSLTETGNMISGSSGGLVSLRELREAVIGNQRFQIIQPTLSLSVEEIRFDVTNKKATNCKVPCYFVACLLAPGADLPDAYKPCFQGRTAFTLPSYAIGKDANVEAWIDLYNEEGKSVMTLKTKVHKGNPGEGLLYWRIPLYTGNGVLLPTGSYIVLGHLLNNGDDFASSWARIFVE